MFTGDVNKDTFSLESALLLHFDSLKNSHPQCEHIFRKVVTKEFEFVSKFCLMIESEHYEKLVDSICKHLLKKMDNPEDVSYDKFREYCDDVYKSIVDPLMTSIDVANHQKYLDSGEDA